MASALDIPVFAVSSMALVVAGDAFADGAYVVAIDALRGELYVGRYAIAGGVVAEEESPRIISMDAVHRLAAEHGARIVGPASVDGAEHAMPRARAVARLDHMLGAAVDLAAWEPSYGRLAEAQVRWEAAHGRALPAR